METEDFIKHGVAEFVGSTHTSANFHYVWKQAAKAGAFADCKSIGEHTIAYCQFVIDKMEGHCRAQSVPKASNEF